MKLFLRTFGQGQPLIILHGLFGQSDNWNTLARQFSENNLQVFTLDLRNHGLSQWSDEMNYQVMSEDVFEFITDNNLKDAIVLGHSMGGKVAMHLAFNHPNVLDKLIIADIAPKYYPAHHQQVFLALQHIDFSLVKTRKDAEAILSNYIDDYGTKQFLLKNIYWKDDTTLAWRFNIKAISENIEKIGEATTSEIPCEVISLFVRGEKSKYITDDDWKNIQELFPRSILETIIGSGHWVHAEKPKEFFDCVMKFVK